MMSIARYKGVSIMDGVTNDQVRREIQRNEKLAAALQKDTTAPVVRCNTPEELKRALARQQAGEYITVTTTEAYRQRKLKAGNTSKKRTFFNW